MQRQIQQITKLTLRIRFYSKTERKIASSMQHINGKKDGTLKFRGT